MLRHYSNTFRGSNFPSGLNSLTWPSSLSRICSTFSLLSPSHEFPVQNSVLFHTQGCFCLPAFTEHQPLHLEAHPCPFPIQSSFLIYFPNEAFFDNRHFGNTIPFNVWTMRPATQSHFFCPLIVSCMYILSLHYILTFTSQEHVFSLCVLCRKSKVSTEAELSEHLLDALFRWAHVEKEDGGKWGF